MGGSIIDEQVDGAVRDALNNEAVVAGELKLYSPVAAQIGTRELLRLGERRFPAHSPPRAAEPVEAGEGAGEEHEFVGGFERTVVGRDLFPVECGSHAPAAKIPGGIVCGRDAGQRPR